MVSSRSFAADVGVQRLSRIGTLGRSCTGRWGIKYMQLLPPLDRAQAPVLGVFMGAHFPVQLPPSGPRSGRHVTETIRGSRSEPIGRGNAARIPAVQPRCVHL